MDPPWTQIFQLGDENNQSGGTKHVSHENLCVQMPGSNQPCKSILRNLTSLHLGEELQVRRGGSSVVVIEMLCGY